MLTNIHCGPHVIRAITNGGYQDYCLLSDFPNLGPIWYNSDLIANNILIREGKFMVFKYFCGITLNIS